MEQQNVRLEKEVYESLKEIAKHNCVTKVSVIEYLIDNYCDDEETLSYAA
jgi:predicted DNA-binding protein